MTRQGLRNGFTRRIRPDPAPEGCTAAKMGNGDRSSRCRAAKPAIIMQNIGLDPCCRQDIDVEDLITDHITDTDDTWTRHTGHIKGLRRLP